MQYLKDILKRFEHLRTQPQFLIVFVGTLVRLPLLTNSLAYATDAWRQADTASIAYHFYANGFKLFYPQIFWGGSGPGYVETEFQLYTFLVAILYRFLGESLWLGKLVSLLFSIAAWLIFYLLAEKVLGERRLALWALGFLVFSPLYIRYSVAYMPEAAVMPFYIAALYFFVKWTSTSDRSDLFLAALSTALAILVKPTSILIGLVFLLLGLDRLGRGLFRRWEVYAAAAIALLPGIAWYWHARNLYLTYGNTFGLFSGGDSKFGNLQLWLQPHLYYHLPYLDWKWILGYGAILLFLAGAGIAVKRREFRLIVFGIVSVGLYYWIVARYAHEEWGIQYHVYMLPFAALAVGLGVKWVAGRKWKFMRLNLLGFSTSIFFITSAFFFFEILIAVGNPLAACGNSVRRVVPQGQLIIVSTTSTASEFGVQNNYQEPQIFFYGKRYGWSLPANWHNVEKLTEYRNAGAAFFVIYSKELLDANPALQEYLDQNSIQVGPGIEKGCAIYRLP